jgi:CHAT domain-containing protein/tetratricopeptide (TPR) repeat protein
MTGIHVVAIAMVAVLLGPFAAHAQDWPVLQARGDSAFGAGRFAEAHDLLTTALAGAEAEQGPDDPAVATVLVSLGRCHIRMGQYTEAEPILRRALAIREQRYGPNSTDVAVCLNNLGSVCKSVGRYSEAEKLYRRYLDITQSVLGAEHPDVAKGMNNLANLLLEEARYNEAEQLLQTALGIYAAEAGTGGSVYLAKTLTNLGALLHLEGRYHDAELYYRQALEVARGLVGEQHPDVAQQLNNLANLYDDTRQFALAESLYTESLRICEATLGPTHDKVATTKRNIARLYVREGRYAEAEPLAREAIEIGTTTLGAENAQLAEFRMTLGDVLLLEGRLDEASGVYDQALAVSEASAGKDHPQTAAVLYSMSMLAETRGDLDKARGYEQRAYSIRRKSFGTAFDKLMERAALESSRFLQEEASHYLSILLDQAGGDDTNRDEVAKVVFSTKGLVSDGVMVRQKMLKEMNALGDSIDAAKNALSRLAVEGPDPTRPWSHDLEIRKAVDRKEQFEGEQIRISAEFRTEKLITQVDAKAISAQLPAGTALVEYMRFDHATGLNSSRPEYLAIVVKSNGRSMAYPLGDAGAIDTAVARYRQHLANVKSLNMDEYRAVSYDLYSLIWQPFETQVTGMSAVLIAPDAALSLVSFAGLRTNDGDYLIERTAIQYVSSGRDLVREPMLPTKTAGLLAIGDPDYDASAGQRSGLSTGTSTSGLASGLISGFMRGGTSSCRALRDMIVGRLPGSRQEVADVVTKWKSTSSEPSTVLFDAQASEDAFKSQCHGKRVVHLATHGYYISSECQADRTATGFNGENPLLQSGLFFSGANLKGQGASEAKLEDGTLTAEEVSGLNLNGTDLVVLSACETGLGEVRTGEGVFGLRRAFQMAGAKTVISALWPVDDKSTAELMGSLFAASEPNIYDAMRKAAIGAIESRRSAGKSDHPFYWAGFIATGEWKVR